MFKKIAAGVGLLGASAASMAAATDLTAVTTALADATTNVVTVGGACLVVYVAVKTFSFVKSALGY